MIKIKKINNVEIVVNSDLIETIETNPDTTITMTTGRKIISNETVDDIINKVIAYKRTIYTK
ncbi:MAG: flagellar FlbD family protein [Lachnospirales bacterium]